ncbi:long-chain-fatty-acid--CoA ligase [Acinetobacter baumannii]|uniref:long-chain-fatty-acid--CoA ligase n=1 Tax=Acinetobacter baumannii TaxID=470 RepID=UPI0029579D93|nr:long-chain-fatty-acid--CoA ligase [Acinetobacter baumannii]MDV7609571.1 long-chain-fatty-acid--CoA ligase [Acinetobacter baumannii]MDV7611362.1 long-chain-fatty-acid--CoA ligase [Acinetobacter baumannii]MDV7615573.1 long-chain-fatty-acid--CoA ligase [Acinetobacter baumannii]
MHLTQTLHKTVRENPSALATVFGQRRHSYAQLQQRVAQLAGAFQQLGVQASDRIGMLSLNSDYYVEYIYATFWAGAVINPVNTRWSVPEIAYSLIDCDTKILLVDDNFVKFIDELRYLCPCLEKIIYCGSGPAPAHTLEYEQLITTTAPIVDTLRSHQDLAAILYTGGTTGKPKGVMLSHASLMTNALATIAATSRPPVQAGLHIAPFFHVGGIAYLIQVSLRAATHVILSGFDPVKAMQTIEKERISETFLVPTMLQMILDSSEFTKYDLSSLSNLIYGAAPIDETLLHRALDCLPNTQFMQVYGMTENAAVVAVLPAFCHTHEGQKLRKLKSVGRPTPITEVGIIHPETGEACKAGQFGEITIRSPTLMEGYWNKLEETSHALRDGWLYTGDGGYLDEDGYLYITDRLKDMIVSGGENVYSSEVENAILTHPAVQLCAVIGIPHEKWGEAVHAVVVVHEGHVLTEDEVKAVCRNLIASYKCPRSVEFRTELPLSGAGKLLKYKLREALQQKNTA